MAYHPRLCEMRASEGRTFTSFGVSSSHQIEAVDLGLEALPVAIWMTDLLDGLFLSYMAQNQSWSEASRSDGGSASPFDWTCRDKFR